MFSPLSIYLFITWRNFQFRQVCYSARYLAKFSISPSMLLRSFVCSYVRMFVCSYVCMLTLSQPQFYTDLLQTIGAYRKWSTVEVIQFWKQKVKGQGQGHQNMKKHIFCNSSATTHHRKTILDALESMKRVLSDGHNVTWPWCHMVTWHHVEKCKFTSKNSMH